MRVYNKKGVFFMPEKRTERIDLRVTPTEKKLLQELAAAACLPLTGFLVGLALGDKLGQLIVEGFPKEDLPDQTQPVI